MAMWLGNATDGVWGLRLIIISIGYIAGLIMGIFLLPVFVVDQFYSSQISGVIGAILAFIVLLALESSIYPKTEIAQ